MKSVLLLLSISLGWATSGPESYGPLEHGLVEKLSSEEMAAIKAWAENSKVKLQNLSELVEGISSRSQRLSLLEERIKQIVSDSSHKRNELFLRYALNRGLYMSQLFKSLPGGDTLDSKIC